MSLTFRAVLAVLLTVVFYALALLVAGALLWQSFNALFRGHGEFSLMLPVAAGFILWGAFPRRAKFEPPGLPVTLTDGAFRIEPTEWSRRQQIGT